MWMAKDARSHGAVILERTACAGIKFDKDLRRVVNVRTDSGDEISCGSAVLCGGAWTKKLSHLMYGKNVVPVAMMPHQYVIFEKTEGAGNHLPVVRDVENKYYIKPEVGGFMVGIFEGEPLEHIPNNVRALNANATQKSREDEHEVYEESVEKAGRWLEAAMTHMPVLGEVGVKQWLHGPDTHSHDHSPLIGRLPGSDNAYIATGFNSQGIQCGPGAGLSLAETILDGAPHSIGCDFSEAEPSRVFPDLCEDAQWVEMRAAEGYGKTFSIQYPLEVAESARGRRLSPIHSELLQAGAVFGETYGWERPLYFPRPEERRTSTEHSPFEDLSIPSPSHCAFSFQRAKAEFFPAQGRECIAARETAALFDLSSFGKLRVSGPQALDVLQMCMTADMDKEIGRGTYSLFCDTRGGIQGDLAVTRLAAEEFYVTTISPQPAKVTDQLNRVALTLSTAPGGCIVEDITESKAILALNGPRARTILKALCEDTLDNDSFPPYTAQHVVVAGMEVMALRVSFAGELGWELHCKAEEAPNLYKALLAAGSEHGLVPGGLMALLNSLRLEKNFVHYGGEINPTVTPLEAGLAFACKLKADQPDFVGKSAILAQRKEGWTKRLVSVKASATDMNKCSPVSLWGHEQELIYRNGELVGALTSGGHSHTLGHAIGQGFIHGPPKVPAKWLQEGSYEVEVPVQMDGAVGLQRFPVEVSTRCLVDPEGFRILG